MKSERPFYPLRLLCWAMEEEGKTVSLRKIARCLGVPWSSVHYKPHHTSTPSVDKAVEKAI